MAERPNILVIDDNPSNLTMVNENLKDTYAVYQADSGECALEILGKIPMELILLDIDMTNMNGLEVLEKIKTNHFAVGIPVIFLSDLESSESENSAFESGVVDYIQKPFSRSALRARVKLHLELEQYRNNLAELVEIKTAQVQTLQDVVLDLLASLSEFRDKDSRGHTRRTAHYVRVLMDNLPDIAPLSYQVTEDFYFDMVKSTPLHDIGKVNIPDAILLKPDKLTEEEFETIKTHVQTGAELLLMAINNLAEPSFLSLALEMVLSHHEKWDGTGYPNGLSGEEIPLSGRIMALIDAYDSLRFKRPYKESLTHEEAKEIILGGRGTSFDPVIVDVFLEVEDEFVQISSSGEI